jgi:endonuclease/exonuclease/phosphatase family metal-dependent hydrolase
MKIATWNLERAPKGKQQRILDQLEVINADILILTETCMDIQPAGNYNVVSSRELLAKVPFEGAIYRPGENRVTICSRYPILKEYATSNPYTSVCAKVTTPYGPLVIYGAIIGTLGNKGPGFTIDMEQQLQDLDQLLVQGKSICYAGDLNTTFGDNLYFTIEGRKRLLAFFDDNELNILTAQLPNNVDHIVMSSSFMKGVKHDITTWNTDKTLSDHIGVGVELV